MFAYLYDQPNTLAHVWVNAHDTYVRGGARRIGYHSRWSKQYIVSPPAHRRSLSPSGPCTPGEFEVPSAVTSARTRRSTSRLQPPRNPPPSRARAPESSRDGEVAVDACRLRLVPHVATCAAAGTLGSGDSRSGSRFFALSTRNIMPKCNHVACRLIERLRVLRCLFRVFQALHVESLRAAC